MRCMPPDYTEAREGRVLFVWGGIPFWIVVDRAAAKFIQQLCDGASTASALEAAAGGDVGFHAQRDAAAILSRLKRAGVLGGRPRRPPRERIESITVNVTNRCNLNCRFCYNAGREFVANELSADEMIRGLESVRRWIVPGAMLALFGGEPLLEKDKTLALARWGRRRSLSPIISTNGLLVDDEFAAAAAETGLECQVSIDGAQASTHDAIRGPGSFDRAVEAARRLVRAGAHTLISMVFHSDNVSEIPDFLRMARHLGAQEARFVPLKSIGGGCGYRAVEPVHVIRMVQRLVDKEPELLPLLGRDHVSILAQTCQSCSPRQTCGTGSQTFLLDADGTIYPCVNLVYPELALGNIKMEQLRSIWARSSRTDGVREQVRLSARIDSCGKCVVRHWCVGGCRGETYHNTGTLNGPSVTCRENRAAILEMFWALTSHPQLRRQGQKYC